MTDPNADVTPLTEVDYCPLTGDHPKGNRPEPAPPPGDDVDEPVTVTGHE